MQTAAYNIISEPKFLMKSVAMIGAVLLLLAETRRYELPFTCYPLMYNIYKNVGFVLM